MIGETVLVPVKTCVSMEGSSWENIVSALLSLLNPPLRSGGFVVLAVNTLDSFNCNKQRYGFI